MTEVWTDGRYAANFIAGLQLGVNEPEHVSNYETVYGPSEGFVYFIAIGEPYVTYVKVGFTRKNPAARLRDLQTGCPFKMRLLGYVFGCRAMEQELHDVLGDDRAEGEWFAYSRYVEVQIDSILTAEVMA